MDKPEEKEEKTVKAEKPNYEIVGVRFDNLTGTHFYKRNQINLKAGDLVIAETDRGEGVGIVVQDCMDPGFGEPPGPLKRLVRKARKRDIDKEHDRRSLERKAFQLCGEKAKAYKLDMNLVSVQYHFDRSKAIFYFTADGRVDFRELVKKLARELNTRIEMRQIGVRDKARLVGGIGSCGRELCCKSFLMEFEPVSVRMAKDQNLPLNPSKISGVCGRLMCCLTYEYKIYKQLCKELPKCGRKVQGPEGCGKVTRQNPLQGTVVVEMEDGKEVTLTTDDLKAKPGSGSPPDSPPDSQQDSQQDSPPKPKPNPRPRSKPNPRSRPKQNQRSRSRPKPKPKQN